MNAHPQSSQPRELLFGHLSPPFLMDELDVLADEVRKGEVASMTAAKGEGLEMPLEGVTGMSPSCSLLAYLNGRRMPARTSRSRWLLP